MMHEKRKFIIWIVGSFQLGFLAGIQGVAGIGLISDVVYRDCFIGLTTVIVVGYAAEYFANKK